MILALTTTAIIPHELMKIIAVSMNYKGAAT